VAKTNSQIADIVGLLANCARTAPGSVALDTNVPNRQPSSNKITP
jgi:hypothetical protein